MDIGGGLAVTPVVWALPMAVGGFVLGWLSARLTEWVTPPEEMPLIRWRSSAVRDPLVQVGLAAVWAAIPFLLGGDGVLRWLEAGLLALPLMQVGVTDLRTRYVYTVIAGIGLLIGLAIGWHVHGAVWWWSAIGAVGGAIAFGLLYGLGRLMYRGGEPMARGDITIAAMVGAGAASQAAAALIYGVIASGVLALGVLVVARSRKVYMPYGPGLCLGGLIT
ncbi:MAG: prepilin peptidase, partial [Chloroflexi bacterium]|nr:prepilin peptidase [Chloroflexota bacterium]